MPPAVASNPSSQIQPPQSRPTPLPLDLSRLPPMHHEAAYEYDSFLSQLTFNSKEVITSLTRIAGENLQAAQAISTVIEQRCFHAPPSAKLPFLYLIDSIVKNIGASYISCFSVNLFHTFTSSYTVVPPQVRMSMHRLINTWPPYFGMDLVTSMRRNITDQDAMNPPLQMPSNPVPQQPVRGNALRIPAQNQPSQPYPFNNQQGRTLNQVGMPPQQLMHQTMGMSNHHQRSQVYPLPHGSVGLSQLPVVSSEPTIPRIRSRPQVHKTAAMPSSQGNLVPPLPPPSPEFIQIENMMEDIARKSRNGIHPTNHQLFTINRLITAQLGLPVPPYHREMLIQYQQRLRDISSVPHNSMPPHSIPLSHIPPHSMPSNQIAPVGVPNVQMSAIPQTVPSSIAGLLRSMPQGMLAKPPQAVSHPLPPNLIPPHSMNSLTQRNYPTSSFSNVAPNYPPSPQASSSDFKTSLPTTLKFSDLKTMSHASVVRSLYTELPHLSKSDGMRFATKEALREHLDWLFQQNRRKRARPEGTAVGGRSRCWYDSLSVFLGKENGSKGGISGQGNGNINNINASKNNTYNKGNDNEEKKIEMVEARGENEVCMACQEGFESVWDDERQAWMLKDATRTEDGDVYHTNCLEVNDANVSADYEHDDEVYSNVDPERTSEQLNESSLGLESPSLKRKREGEVYSQGYEYSVKDEKDGANVANSSEKRARMTPYTEDNVHIAQQQYSSEPVAKTETINIKEEDVAQSETEKINSSGKAESSLVGAGHVKEENVKQED